MQFHSLGFLLSDLMFQGGHGGYGGGHGGSGTACIVKGSYCQCHYCKCEKGHVSCKGYGHDKGYGKLGKPSKYKRKSVSNEGF